MVMCSTLLLEIGMAIILTDTRYSLGFYASRFYSDHQRAAASEISGCSDPRMSSNATPAMPLSTHLT
jgi:hypothetical protein